MLEVLSPAGTSDALVAAVQNGADAVYLGYSSFNARINAGNFTSEQLRQSVSYCHVRGVKVYLTLNTLVSDRELKQAATVAQEAAAAGVDAILVQDLGVAQMLRTLLPDMPLHASTQMAVHSLEGVLQAAEMGMTRVVVARELSRDEIAYICKNSPVEIEVFVHGALCMCHSGQCYLSAMIGTRSGNRGQCAQPCRLPYGYDRGENRHPLSLKDNCLVEYLRELEGIGVCCVKIEGRMKRAEYVAITTRIYKSAAEGRRVTPEQLKSLERVFSRQGFTDGYYTGKKGSGMFGVRGDEEPDRVLLSRARETYENSENCNVPVRMRICVYPEQPATLYITDRNGHSLAVQGPVPEPARKAGMSREALVERLGKTGGTPYAVESVRVELMPGLVLSAAAVNALRREALSALTALRGQVPAYSRGTFVQPEVFRTPVKGGKKSGTEAGARPVGTGYTIQVQNLNQITEKVLAFRPDMLYIPISLLNPNNSLLSELCSRMRVCAVLPRVIFSSEWDRIRNMLTLIKTIHVRDVLVGNIGMLRPAREMGFRVHGDFGLNVFNSGTANYLAAQGLKSLTASFELTLPQIRDLSKPVPMEMFVYGRLPLMITENCIIHERAETCTCGSSRTSLVDRKGSRFPVIRDQGTCRSQLLNSKKLYLGDRMQRVSATGVSRMRISFTTENEKEIAAVLSDFRTGAAFDPGTCTRGLYVRGVE